MKTQSTLQRTLKALFITGIAVFALASAHAEDLVQVTAETGWPAITTPNLSRLCQILDQDSRVTSRDSEQRERRALWATPTLLPIANGVDADVQRI